MAVGLAVNTTAQEVFDGDPPDTKSSLISSILNGNDIVATLISDERNGDAFRISVDNYYDAVANTEKIGIPIPFNFSASDENELALRPSVQAIIAAEESVAVSNIVIINLEIEYVDKYKLIREYYQDAADYNIPSESFFVNSEYYYPLSNGVPRWASSSATTLDIVLRPEWERSGNSRPDDLIKSASIPFRAGNTLYINAQYYYKLNTPGKTNKDGNSYKRIWTYRNGSSTSAPYTNINVDTSLIEGGDYLPIVPFRSGGVWIEESPYYKDTFPAITAAMNAVGLDYYDLKKAVNPELQVGWSSGDMPLKDLDDAALIFAVDLSLDEDIFNRYLFQAFLTYHYNLDGATQAEWYAWRNGSNWETTNRPRNMIEIRTVTLTFRLEYQWSSVQIRTGNIATDGEYNPATILTNQPSTVNHATEAVSTAGQVVRKEYIGAEFTGSQSGTHRSDRLVFRKPLASDATKYIEVVIFGLVGIYDIQIIGWQDEGQFRVSMNTWDAGNLVLPVSRDFVKKFSRADQEVILYRTLQIMLYTASTYSLSWLNSNLFKFAFFVFQVLTVFIPGVQTFSLALKRIATEGAKAVIKELLKKMLLKLGEAILIALTVGVASYMVIKVFGLDAGVILYALIAAMAVYLIAAGGSVIGLDAASMLAAVQGVDFAYNISLYEDYMDLEKDMKDFDKSIEEKREASEKITDGLDENYSLSSLAIIRAPVRNTANESVTGFYNRTIHNGNPGVLSLLTPNLFVQTALDLPKPDYNIGTRYA